MLFSQIQSVAAELPASNVAPLVHALASALEDSPHLEFLLTWLHHVTTWQGPALQTSDGRVRTLSGAVSRE